MFIAFNALATWIAKNEQGIDDLASYCDDSFGVELMSDFTYYELYQRWFPSSQTALLELWDKLRSLQSPTMSSQTPDRTFAKNSRK